MFCCSGILFNHESPRRGLEFLPRKVTHSAAKIKLGLQKELKVGNLEAKRDEGFAGDYVEAMWLMLQQDQPDDYVVSTGISHSVKDLVKIAFDHMELDWQDYVISDTKLFRPAEVDYPLRDSRKAKLECQPKVTFEELIKRMAENDLQLN